MKKLIDSLARAIAERLIARMGMAGFRVAVVNVQPGDVILVRSDVEIVPEAYSIIKAQWEDLFPNNRVVFMNSFHVDVVHEAATEKPGG